MSHAIVVRTFSEIIVAIVVGDRVSRDLYTEPLSTGEARQRQRYLPLVLDDVVVLRQAEFDRAFKQRLRL
ncbi:MAG: hypothetical protein JKY37_28125 [Nannocystaceae bacterium]|nr:hypothetical protein [Nannocystaceae bacterium]